MVGAGLVHGLGPGVDVAAGDQPGAGKIAPGGELAGRVEIRVVELAAVVGHADHHLGAAETVEQPPGRLAARVGARVDLGVEEMAVQMPLAGVVRVARRHQFVLGDHVVEVVLGQRHQRLVLRQLDHQLHRVHAAMLGELEQAVAVRIALAQAQAVATGEGAHRLGRQRLAEGDEDAVGDEEVLARVRQGVGVVGWPQRARARHQRIHVLRPRAHPRRGRGHLLGVVGDAGALQRLGQRARHEGVGALGQFQFLAAAIGVGHGASPSGLCVSAARPGNATALADAMRRAAMRGKAWSRFMSAS